MKSKLLMAFVTVLSLPWNRAIADETSWMFKWDQELPSLVLRDVALDANSVTDAWRKLTASHMVRCVLVLSQNIDSKTPFAFYKDNCTLSEVLDALCANFGLQWTVDESTGVIWVGPLPWARETFLSERVNIPEQLRAVPMHTGVLEKYLRSFDQDNTRIVLHAWTDRWLNKFDYPVSIDAGSYSIYDLLNRCLVWNPSITFFIHEDIGGRIDILDVNIPLSDRREVLEGAQLFWQLESGNPGEVPNIEQIEDWLGHSSARKRWAAQQYLGLTVWSGNLQQMLKRLSMGLQDETQARAFFSFVQFWIPKGIPHTMPRELEYALTETLNSESFRDFSADTQLRLVGLSLARTNNPQEKNLVLRKIPRPSARVLSAMDFDFRAFMNNNPGVEEKFIR